MEEVRFQIRLTLEELIGHTKDQAKGLLREKLFKKLNELVAEGWDIDLDKIHYDHKLDITETNPLSFSLASSMDKVFDITLQAKKKSPDQLYREQFDYFINR